MGGAQEHAAHPLYRLGSGEGCPRHALPTNTSAPIRADFTIVSAGGQRASSLPLPSASWLQAPGFPPSDSSPLGFANSLPTQPIGQRLSSHFPDEGMEAPRGRVTSPRSQLSFTRTRTPLPQGPSSSTSSGCLSEVCHCAPVPAAPEAAVFVPQVQLSESPLGFKLLM